MNDVQEVKRLTGVPGMVNCVLAGMAKAATIAAPLFVRVALALPFFKSGLTKWDGLLSLSPAASFLFEDEFKLHILGRAYDLPAPDLLALASGSAEIVFPILLILGVLAGARSAYLMAKKSVMPGEEETLEQELTPADKVRVQREVRNWKPQI